MSEVLNPDSWALRELAVSVVQHSAQFNSRDARQSSGEQGQRQTAACDRLGDNDIGLAQWPYLIGAVG